MTRIKIKSCKNELLWYHSHIGEIFEVQKEEPDAYWCLEPNVRFRLLNWVYKTDAEVVIKDRVHEIYGK